MASKKRKGISAESKEDQEDLFGTPGKINDVEGSDGDSTDSEESVYSGLEDEEDSDEDNESVESFEEARGSMDEDESSDADGEEDDDEEEEEEDDEEESESGSSESDKSNEDEKINRENDKKTTEEQPSVSEKPESSAKSSVKTDEFEHGDSSDEEDIRNTVGNVPMEWYREYDHLGYDILGKKIIKPASGDQIDEFLAKMENPDYWRTVKDKTTGQSVVLSDADAEMIKRIRRGKSSDTSYNPYEPFLDIFSHEVMKHPVSNRPETKKSFIPSLWEKQKVGKLVHAIKMGWIKPREKKDDDEMKFYELWDKEDDDPLKRHRHHIPAPKLALPGHAESYNPPPEYLFTEEEKMAWKDKDPEDRRQNFIPEKYDCLRKVPAYKRFINERFERCLDLYLCPRQRKMRMNVNPEDLLPKLPKPSDLQPFPMVQSLVYKGHTGIIRSLSTDPTGQWLVSGSDDNTLKMWEVATGRCMKTMQMKTTVKNVAWNPNPSFCLVLAAVGEEVLVINPQLGDKLVISKTDEMLANIEPAAIGGDKGVKWEKCQSTEYEEGLRLRIIHAKAVNQVTWHGRGDYFASVIPQTEAQSVFIHQLTKHRSQTPFKKAKGMVQCVLFHPTRPFFFVATQRFVRVYNLLKQELTKKLMTNVKWVSSMAVHPGGDNVIIGSYDTKLSWFDLDLSNKPYQTLRHHKKAIRQVSFHKRYPLFASASDDGTVIVCHGRVYNDLLQNPLIVPVKILRGHQAAKFGVMDCEFHPTQPWVFSSGADHTIRLFT